MADNPVVRRLLHIWFLLQRPATLGTRVLVEDTKQRVLLVRHTYVSGWYFPGGGVETGQTQYDSAARELWEETGIVNKGDLELIGVYHNRTASKRDHVTLFRCRDWEQPHPFKPNREIAEARFFTVAELPEGTTAATRRRIEEIYNGGTVSEWW